MPKLPFMIESIYILRNIHQYKFKYKLAKNLSKITFQKKGAYIQWKHGVVLLYPTHFEVLKVLYNFNSVIFM